MISLRFSIGFIFTDSFVNIGTSYMQKVWCLVLRTNNPAIPPEVAMSDQYGIVGSPVTLACVGISPGGNKPTLSIYKGETMLARSEDPQLTSVSFSKSQKICLVHHF